MTNAEYKKKRLEKKTGKRDYRNGFVSGMGIRLSVSAPDNLPYPRIKSARRFIKLVDGVTCLTILYETFGYSGYGAKRVECIHRREDTLLERYGENLCWK